MGLLMRSRKYILPAKGLRHLEDHVHTETNLQVRMHICFTKYVNKEKPLRTMYTVQQIKEVFEFKSTIQPLKRSSVQAETRRRGNTAKEV